MEMPHCKLPRSSESETDEPDHQVTASFRNRPIGVAASMVLQSNHRSGKRFVF